METEVIQEKIHEIRGVRVMLDSDLAALYGVETKVLNRAVKRNAERFPERFMFQLTREEALRFQNGTLNVKTGKLGRGQHFKYLPYAFTEQGVAMLSAVLRSPTAVQVSISIMDAFVAMRNYLLTQAHESAEIAALRERVLRLEQATDGNLEAMNDLSEDLRQEIDRIYDAIGALSIRTSAIRTHKPIGFKKEPAGKETQN